MSISRCSFLIATLLLGASAGAQIQIHWQDPKVYVGDRFERKEEHEIRLFDHGMISLQERLDMIERATKTIDVEYFIYATDTSSRLLTQALVRKAKQGVKVRMLIDCFLYPALEIEEFLTMTLNNVRSPDPADPTGKKTVKNIQVRHYNVEKFEGLANPIELYKKGLLRTVNAQRRNHRKHLIIDGAFPTGEVISGGRNIEDDYFDLSMTYNFIDRDVWVKGPIVADVAKTFDAMWEHPMSKTLDKPERPEMSTMDKVKQEAAIQSADFDKQVKRYLMKLKVSKAFVEGAPRDKAKLKLVKKYAALQAPLVKSFSGPVVYATGRGLGGLSPVWKEIQQRVVDAKKSFLAESPYLVLTKKKGFQLLDVMKSKSPPVVPEVLTNSFMSSDNDATSAFFYRTAVSLREHGAMVQAFDGHPTYPELVPEFVRSAVWGTHAKTLVFDEMTTAIGSFNFDPRSQNINYEGLFVFPDNPQLAKAVTDSIRERLKYSHKIADYDSELQRVVKIGNECARKLGTPEVESTSFAELFRDHWGEQFRCGKNRLLSFLGPYLQELL